ncbi:hypothetical protein PCANC_09806 [Puccinia coronata f. sp. avenae]|uniref:DNA 3'-5' helicase n=1 Tax=Puccinia coronata f. sp. avenae TaxID=200324 RepID=A0A2N5T0K6_9BASI|nr:hypothetical protein PCANC_09806 [Puccinia coronata f. sp. avenae]
MTTKHQSGRCIGVVVVLSPLDALGDDKVSKKIAAGYSAINLTSPSFTHQAAIDLKNGAFNFVYLSPKIFLNNKVFEDIYLSPDFQQKLVLVVVDEAHMIYTWGIAKTGCQNLKTLVRHQDQGKFCPSYGNLSSALLNKNKALLLLMSGTCPPKAIKAIKNSLKLTETDIHLICGELTQPEICILRIPMSHSMSSCKDVAQIYLLACKTPNDQLVPYLIYSGICHATLTVLQVLVATQGTPVDHTNPESSFGCRYHAVTGALDKADCIEGFSQGQLPVIGKLVDPGSTRQDACRSMGRASA